MADSPGSPLSSHSSSEFTEDIKLVSREASFDIDRSYTGSMPPTKRQKTGMSSFHSTPQYNSDAREEEELGDISSDTSGSAPSSPYIGAAYTQDEDQGEQVTVCKWRNCPAGNLGNMDELVVHTKDVHIDHHTGRAQKKFVCEWEGCPRMGAPHASAYALRSHMRSHTKEKPFFCALPECDKCFTRSDALSKHMRTVHETEALRPSDPIPRNHAQTQVKPQKLKLTFKKGLNPENGTNTLAAVDDDGLSATMDAVNGTSGGGGKGAFAYPTDLTFTDEELTMAPDYLYKLCRRQLHWSGQEGERLKKECAELGSKLRQEWQKKELVLANLMEADLAQGTLVGKGEENEAQRECVSKMVARLLPAVILPLQGETPWYRRGGG